MSGKKTYELFFTLDRPSIAPKKQILTEKKLVEKISKNKLIPKNRRNILATHIIQRSFSNELSK